MRRRRRGSALEALGGALLAVEKAVLAVTRRQRRARARVVREECGWG